MCLKRKFSAELERTLSSTKAFAAIPSYQKFEIISSNYFAIKKPTKTIREGHFKQSFLYFLIDPRISGNLPSSARASEQIISNNLITELEKVSMWRQFLDSIFYVGKAKTSRPYFHLYEAMKFCNKHLIKKLVVENSGNPKGKKHATQTFLGIEKVCRIADIWQNGFGVVSLQAFHNILPCEAYTREAAIIDALSLNHLTNKKCGNYYGPANNWTPRGKKLFGISLLYRALQIFLAEGETQIFPTDLV